MVTPAGMKRRFWAIAVLIGALSGCATDRVRNAQTGASPETSVPASSPVWLIELNNLRAIGGLTPVAQDPDLSRECQRHAQYLVESGPDDPTEFVNYRTSLGLGAHHEDPSNPHYSVEGSDGARGGQPTPGFAQAAEVSWARDPISDIDGLFYDAPFHRLALLASWATLAGYGSYGEWPRRAGALALRGPGRSGSPLIRFPSDGSTVPFGDVRNRETPDPLASCPGYRRPIGLPITITLGSGYRWRLLSNSVEGPRGKVETCAFDDLTYQNPDAHERDSARDALRHFGAIVIIPRFPLENGAYKVTVTNSHQSFVWSFKVTREARSPDTARK